MPTPAAHWSQRWPGLIGVAVFALVLGWVTIARDVDIPLSFGDWPEITRGLALVRGPAGLGGRSTATLAVEDPQGTLRGLRIEIARRNAHVPVQLELRGDSSAMTVALGTASMTLRVPSLPGSGRAWARLDATSPINTGHRLFQITALTVERDEQAGHRWRGVLPLLVAVGAWLLGCRSRLTGGALLWGLAGALATVALLTSTVEPLGALLIATSVRPWLLAGLVVAIWLLALLEEGTPWAALAALVTTVLLLYARTLTFGLVADDFCFVRPLSALERHRSQPSCPGARCPRSRHGNASAMASLALSQGDG